MHFFTRDGVVKLLMCQLHPGSGLHARGGGRIRSGKSVPAMSIMRLIPEPPGRV
jgi:ABC-type dipeptide/oligopeptide/nickel transport system ATPase component